MQTSQSGCLAPDQNLHAALLCLALEGTKTRPTQIVSVPGRLWQDYDNRRTNKAPGEPTRQRLLQMSGQEAKHLSKGHGTEGGDR